MNFKRIASYSVVLLALFITTIFIVLSGCKKQTQVAPSDIYNETYLRTLSFPGFQSGRCLKQTEDGNLLFFWVDFTDTTASQISKMDLTGKVLWKQKVLGNLAGANFVTLSDGSILITSYGTFIKLDKNGQKLIECFPSTAGGFPVEAHSSGPLNGFYLQATSDGMGTGLASTNTLSFLDHNGKDSVVNPIIFPDAYFKCKVLEFNVFRYEDPNTYYFWGAGFINWTGSWVANPHTFFAKITMDATNTNMVTRKLLFIDSTDNLNLYDITWGAPSYQLMTSNKNVLVSQSFKNVNSGLINSKLIKVDSNLNLVWQKEIPFEGSNNEIHTMENCADGGFLVSGRTYAANTKVYTPFYCKYSASGNLLWKNTLATPRYGEAWWGIQLRDGGYMFTGNTTSFGKDINDQDFFLLKTDNFGNLK